MAGKNISLDVFRMPTLLQRDGLLSRTHFMWYCAQSNFLQYLSLRHLSLVYII